MLTIVDNFSKRTIDILKILSEKNDWITIKDISEQLNVSEKTIHDNLKYIREDLSDKVVIESSNIRGIRTIDFPVNIFLEVQSHILFSSISIKFILKVLEKPHHDLNYYSEELHVSRSTLYRTIPVINEFFTQYGVEIHRERSLYSIIGKDEYTCRRFFTTFIYEVNEYKTNPFIPDIWKDFYRERIFNLYTLNKEIISDIQLGYYSIFYHFSSIREQTGFPLDTPPDFKGKILPLDTTDYFDLYNSNNQQLPTDTMLLIEQSICIHRHTMFAKTDKFYIRETHQFINNIYNTFQIPDDEKKKILVDFLVDLCINIDYFGIPYHFFNDRFTSFSYQIKNDHALVHKTLSHLIDLFAKKTKLDFSIYYNHLIYLFVVTIPGVLQANIHKPLLFVSNYSEEHSDFMSNMIQRQLGISPSLFSNSKSIHLNQLSNTNISDYQVVISNLDLGSVDYPSILVNDFPTKKDILHIKKFLS